MSKCHDLTGDNSRMVIRSLFPRASTYGQFCTWLKGVMKKLDYGDAELRSSCCPICDESMMGRRCETCNFEREGEA